jgi:hypothetical protein
LQVHHEEKRRQITEDNVLRQEKQIAECTNSDKEKKEKMTFDEIYNQFNGIIRDVQTNTLGDIMIQIGIAATTMIRNRIIESGENADGGKFPPYSTKSMLSGCKNFIQKKSCETYINSDPKWVTIKRGDKNYHLFEIPGGYKQYRELNQRQSGFVDFSFSDQMWRNIKVCSSNTEHNKGIVRIGAITDLDKAKLAGNTKRKGVILKLSKSEIRDLSKYAKKRLIQIFHKNE